MYYGPATWFLTLSPSEWAWNDLGEYLQKVNRNMKDLPIGQMCPRMSKHSHQSGHIYQCTATRRRDTERFKSKTMITITGLGDYQNYRTTPMFGLVHLKDKSLETLFHLHQSQGHIMLKYRLVKLGETVHI